VVRADPAGQDKGGGAAAAALHLVALCRKWAGQSKGVGYLPLGENIRIASDDKGPTRA
jgi:6,7-dimethyl-8-ribityllumazine synthase